VGIYLDFPSFAHFETRFTLNTSADSAATYAAKGFGKLNEFMDAIETSVAGHAGAFLVERTFEVGIAEGLYFNYLDKDEVERIAKVLPSISAIDFIIYVNYKYRKGDRLVSLLPDRYLVRISFASSSIRVFQLGGMRRTPPSDVLLLASTQIDSGAQDSGFRGAVFNIEGLEDSRKTEKIV
jgi:hypothetical protein